MSPWRLSSNQFYNGIMKFQREKIESIEFIMRFKSKEKTVNGEIIFNKIEHKLSKTVC